VVGLKKYADVNSRGFVRDHVYSPVRRGFSAHITDG
jgi:hypothetical protein